jgi:type IV secretion system protein TrbI
MSSKTKVLGTLRPGAPKPRGLSRKVILGVAGVGATAIVAVFALDPGLTLRRDTPAERPPVPSNVKPDLAGLPSDYGEVEAASMFVPDEPRLPPPLDTPAAAAPQTDGQPFRAAGTGRAPPRKVRRGISVGGDDGLGDTGRGQAPLPGVRMAADQPGQPPGQPRTLAQGFRQQNQGAGSMYLGQELQAPLGEWEIWPGTIIPAKLASATNSELGGNVVARVSADIYDNRTGRCVLIPRDSTVFGKLSDEVQYGQRRQQAVWTMLILPNGGKLPLMGMDATDGAGRAGITAAVNNHYGRLAGAALAATALDVLGSLGRSNNSGTQINIGGAAADNAASIGERIIQRELNVQPTLEQAIGHPVSLMVDRTITMECYNG